MAASRLLTTIPEDNAMTVKNSPLSKVKTNKSAQPGCVFMSKEP